MRFYFGKRTYLISIALVLIIVLASCSSGPGPESGTAPEPQRKMIIDTDAGADDAAAIILAAADNSIEIEGITVLAGNVDLEQAGRNTLMALETAGVSAPVYKGAETSLNGKKKIPFSVFGKDGMGDADLIHPSGKAEEGDAVDFILETVRNDPGEIEIAALGPATNIAGAIEKDPETMKQVKMIWSLGTAGLGVGNATPVAEFNVYSDAEAYKIMLDSGIPVTVVGFDMCLGDAKWTDRQFDRLEESGDSGEFVTKSFEKIREFYRGNGSDAVAVCDPIAIMCAQDEDFVTDSAKYHGSCITDEGETYGEVIFYKEGFKYDAPTDDFDYNVTLVKGIDSSTYFERYLKAIQQTGR